MVTGKMSNPTVMDLVGKVVMINCGKVLYGGNLIIGKLLNFDHSSNIVVIENPRVIVVSEDKSNSGSMMIGFQRIIGALKIYFSVEFYAIIEPDDEMVRGYNSSVSNIVLVNNVRNPLKSI